MQKTQAKEHNKDKINDKRAPNFIEKLALFTLASTTIALETAERMQSPSMHKQKTTKKNLLTLIFLTCK